MATFGAKAGGTQLNDEEGSRKLPNQASSKVLVQKRIKPKGGKGKNGMVDDVGQMGAAKDPSCTFGCTCTVCQQHVLNLRRMGDQNAIKAHQNEEDFNQMILERANKPRQAQTVLGVGAANQAVPGQPVDRAIEKKGFAWLVEHMLPPEDKADKICGCEV
jgi:hypothetical protein